MRLAALAQAYSVDYVNSLEYSVDEIQAAYDADPKSYQSAVIEYYLFKSGAEDDATDEEKAELKRLCDEVENLYLAGENHLQKDVEFHTYIARCSKNKVIEKLVPIIQSAVITFVNLTHRQLKDETIDTHRAITDAILNGDSAGAKYAMIMHLNYNRQMILKKQAKAQQKNE